MKDQDDLGQGLRLIAVAVASAVVTATLVISAGGAALDRVRGDAAPVVPVLIRTSG